MVLDAGGLEAWARPVPPRALLTAMEVLRRAGSGRVVAPSVVTVEVLTGNDRDAPVNRALKQIDVEQRLPLPRARAAARLRHGISASAVDAVVAEAAVRHEAAFVVTSDPDDLTTLLARAAATSQVVRV